MLGTQCEYVVRAGSEWQSRRQEFRVSTAEEDVHSSTITEQTQEQTIVSACAFPVAAITNCAARMAVNHPRFFLEFWGSEVLTCVHEATFFLEALGEPISMPFPVSEAAHLPRLLAFPPASASLCPSALSSHYPPSDSASATSLVSGPCASLGPRG